MKLKKDIKLIVFSAVLLLLIAGCKGGSKDTAGKAPTTPFLGGSQGLEIGFLEGSPPDEVTDGNNFPFNAIVRLKNLGEYKFDGTDQIKISLAGFLPSDFSSATEDLQDKTPTEVPTPKQRDSEGNIIEAIETLKTFPKDDAYFKYEGSVAGNTNFIFKADVCYKYQTKAVSEICVLSSLINVADDAICKPSETKTVFSSGSPIKVTSFRQNVVGDKKIQFSFDVSHDGAGQLFGLADARDAATLVKLDGAIDLISQAVAKAVKTERDSLITSTESKLSGMAQPKIVAAIAKLAAAKAAADIATGTPILNEAKQLLLEEKGIVGPNLLKVVQAIVLIDATIALSSPTPTDVSNNIDTIIKTKLAGMTQPRILDAIKKINDARAAANSGSGTNIADAKALLGEARLILSEEQVLLEPPDCPKSPATRRTKEDTIKVTVDTGLAANSLSCPVLPTTPSGAATAVKTGSVKLVNGKRTITCTQDLTSYTSDFKRSIDITIDFNYLDGASKNVLVKHIVTS